LFAARLENRGLAAGRAIRKLPRENRGGADRPWGDAYLGRRQICVHPCGRPPASTSTSPAKKRPRPRSPAALSPRKFWSARPRSLTLVAALGDANISAVGLKLAKSFVGREAFDFRLALFRFRLEAARFPLRLTSAVGPRPLRGLIVFDARCVKSACRGSSCGIACCASSSGRFNGSRFYRSYCALARDSGRPRASAKASGRRNRRCRLRSVTMIVIVIL